MERRQFRDYLQATEEVDRSHDVSDIAAEPRFRREARPAALIASEAHHGSLAIIRRESVDRRQGDADRDRRECSRGCRHLLQLAGMKHQPDRRRRVEHVFEPERFVRLVERVPRRYEEPTSDAQLLDHLTRSFTLLKNYID